ncbi:GNAT family N-acetyltransferase [Amphiplicatus metriothermophilus]|uniref:Acetyltransferase (GNAT) family protein n=1 Tax=Amphiplicatus metriothermophilus TaxID=1519374 RepID=A0A239PTF9_9PROT|nr:GNAT family N-acetyltransferase [Amphiplicatus metriothermophilus]MBB5519126.1 ribosomal protein S18 acetylase RimI-like enzyme [Amphiplicatus metriothermophilus]SNT73196.1 Acetyltransferase (GNAT) family protein [Amphiplicatus metriothermophilus]
MPDRHDITVLSARAEAEAAARFAAALLKKQPDYISHGEVQGGRSPDGARWADDLEARLAAEFAAAIDDPDTDVLLARDANGALAGFALLALRDEGAGPFGVIEDIAVAPEARGSGLGRSLVAEAEARARRRGARWMWLESGLRNAAAHRFFENLDYRPASKVFGKPLAD